MDDTRTMNVDIPYHTWGPKRRLILSQFTHVRAAELHYVEGFTEDLMQRLQRVLLMARRAVLDLIGVR